ncbi:PREDICTED: LOW QUALITY PROTEIN: up-regulator of cell proliferation-like [Nanorana parkeri]|uniref:LOW QUALITY PROTEIN: up-regulator of cell proliferation-like n=1 Tax=Nanorana parkeri TaxID=125878 RepID=UPI00085509D8|nr:PREDICTED: LOW QUALITY PROTEIN: up-regulator of cell proliferation-like [Nanorana parkeri]
MKMKPYLTSKLTLRDVLSIDLENLHDKPAKTVEDLPWNYLRKLMALNQTAREILLDKDQSVDDDDDDNNLFNAFSIQGETNSSNFIHPLDVLCVLLHCSGSFLQQEIVTKMAMCQFAVPLLLPAGDGSHCTFMLWAMRDIVKKWRPQSLADSKGFKEENVVNVPMPIYSFVRLGKTKLSKSKTLNQVLNPVQLHNNFFIHDNMDGGNLKRKMSDGLVEMSWYFPCGKSDVFPEPIAVANLRGDLEANWDQFMFLTRVSSAVFIFIESISEEEFRLLSSCSNTDTKYYFIVTPGPGKTVSTQTLETLQNLSPVLKLKKSNVILYAGKANDAAFVGKLQSSMVNFLHKNMKRIIMTDLGKEAIRFKIHVDESDHECQKARELASSITEEIKDVADYKQSTMILQGDLWKRLSKVEKELSRMKNQGGKDTHQYQDALTQKHSSIREKRSKHDLSHRIMLFIDALTQLSKTGKQYFLKWMKIELDSITREHLSELQALYKEKCNDKTINKEELKRTDQKISDSSLGIEHFLREMGQYYEAEYFMLKKNKIAQKHRQFTGLPGIASDLLMDGFPLELIDGDASSIPLQWITDVLTELDTKMGRKCRIRVITVLGVQSTGKSTLLNTMFGLQFPVASGRCTRGAFMTLLNVKENLQEELGCRFILVIDTEGLKAPELASLEGSYEHDNELATLVVGLSDISIINMAMENTTEMKDILQIVVHAFLRMKEVGKKPNCQFVHQNVSDVSAHNKNMRDRKKLLEQLDEMTKVASKMEEKTEINHFSDVMDYNLEKDNWYIPGLWLGVPPMASINSGYSEHVSELKKHLLDFVKCKRSLHRPLTIPEFITWIESLWTAVKHEKFIFSFRNSLVADAYNKLSIQYSQWEWDFQKAVSDWMICAETNIRNENAESLTHERHLTFENELKSLCLSEEEKSLDLLENYFENKQENVHLIERYKEDFVLSIKSLKKKLERNALGKYEEVVSIQKGKMKIQNMQCNSQKSIEDKITVLLTVSAKNNQKLSDEELQKEFDKMWEKTLADLQIEKIERRVVSKSMLQELINDMSNKGSAVQELLLMKDLDKTVQLEFKIDKKYIKDGLLQRFIGAKSHEPYEKIKRFSAWLISKCDAYVREKAQTAEDYNDTYCKEILHISNTELTKESKNLNYSQHFELDIKCHILTRASGEFQVIHDKFIKENDPKLCLEKLKPQYLSTFINTFQEKDICQTKAKEFCEQCLKAAMKDYVFKHLGKKIVDDIMQSSGNRKFSSRTFFQSFLLKMLLEKMSFQEYLKYIGSYEEYTKDWILNYIENKYANAQTLKTLEENILLEVSKEVKAALEEDQSLKSPSVERFLKSVCEGLKNLLVIPHSALKLVTFQNKAAVGQFSSDIQLFLQDTESEILSELQSMNIKSVLSRVTMKPQDELFRKVVGCGKQCPFCKVPCEAGGDEHKEHFATIHRPEGLGRYRWLFSGDLSTNICSSSVVSDVRFRNLETKGKPHPFKEYRTYFPDWSIQPDPSIESSDYWKYIFAQFNMMFAKEYNARPANLPDSWKNITKEQALESLKKSVNVEKSRSSDDTLWTR